MIGLNPWTSPAPPRAGLLDLLEQVAQAAGSADAALQLAGRAAEALPPPGAGRTAELWRGLAEIAAVDLTVARALEPHLDALAILGQAREEGYAVPDAPGATWGVFAAEGPGARLSARPVEDDQEGGDDQESGTDQEGGDDEEDGQAAGAVEMVLTGRKPWCSLAGRLDRALVTAWVDQEQRGLFAIDLHHPGVALVDEPWAARGLREVRSTGLDLSDVPARPVGPPGWYLTRPGFAWGGLGVAAVWLGGAMGLARRLREAAAGREPDQIGLVLLGRVDAELQAAAAVLTEAARAVDAGQVQGEHAWARVVRTRGIVHDACETVLRAAAHGLGPGPLAGEEAHAARVADLQLYLRQHKAERDTAVVGRAVVDGMPTSW